MLIPMGRILHQIHLDGKNYPIYSDSCTYKSNKYHLANTKGELLVAVYEFTKFKNYVGLKEFCIVEHYESVYLS